MQNHHVVVLGAGYTRMFAAIRLAAPSAPVSAASTPG